MAFSVQPSRQSLQNSNKRRESGNARSEGARSVDGLASLFDPTIAQQFNPEQWQEIRRILGISLPKPSPKIVDIRFTVDLLLSRFFVVLFVGEDRRRTRRKYPVTRLSNRIGNFIAVIILLLALNLLVSASIIVFAYLLKSAVGIDILPGHFRDIVMQIPLS